MTLSSTTFVFALPPRSTGRIPGEGSKGAFWDPQMVNILLMDAA